jgi:hypothetical protein
VAAAVGPMAPAEASPAVGSELQPLLARSDNSSSRSQRMPPPRAGSDWLSDDDDSEASVQLLPPEAPLATSLASVHPAAIGDSNTLAAAAAADSLQTGHAPLPAVLAAAPYTSYSEPAVGAAAATDSSADADSFVVAGESIALLHTTDGSLALQDALPVAALMEVSAMS